MEKENFSQIFKKMIIRDLLIKT
ncbi:hypothetical protein Gotri_007569 [Gossypium trilobum]|uniref:Uncharacterized protein n=1 Tax=Gossypium trilobum TaxID=34281 RepID=A0A7J9EGH6_9ROSI|nr:hypothetical protein [Gossypium trilobum]